MFPVLGVRENMTVQVLDDFVTYGLVSPVRERADAEALATELNIVTPTLEQPISHLSGGNQQKAVLARAFLRKPKLDFPQFRRRDRESPGVDLTT